MKRLIFALLLVGITSIISQIVLIRELLLVFYGNELSIGIILANWLCWTSCGSWLAARLARKIKQPIYFLIFAEVALAVIIFLTVICVRGIKLWLGITPGEILGIVPIWSCSFVLLAALCLVNGCLFVAGCGVYQRFQKDRTEPAETISKVYVLEAIGAGVGGVLAGLLLLRIFNSLQIVWLVSLLNLVSAGCIWPAAGRWGHKLLYLAALTLFLAGVMGGLEFLQQKTRQWQWPGYQLLASEDSVYGNITVTRYNSHYNFYESGLLAYSVPDTMSAEETVHLGLLQCESPEKVLLLGGGTNGTIAEILKYSMVKKIDYLELDPLVIRLAKKILPKEQLSFLGAKRVNLHFVDGRRFLKTTAERYDLIIVNLPDPYTAQFNRFYTEEFFLAAAAKLGRQGVMAFAVTSAENYISTQLGDFLRCLYYTLKEVFPQVIVLPGESAYFIGGQTQASPSSDYLLLQQRLDRSGVSTRFIRDYYLEYRLSKERRDYLQTQLDLSKPIPINTDFRPVCYYYDITFWSTYFSNTFQKVFLLAARIKLWHFVIPLLLVGGGCFLCRRAAGYNYVLFPLMASGFSEISFQVVTLLAFQVIYGYLYSKLSYILASFMLGLAAGGYVISRLLPRLKNNYSLFLQAQIAITFYPLLLPLVFVLFSQVEGKLFSWLGENVVFPLLPVFSGFVGGVQFPLGNRIYLQGTGDLRKAAGITYAVDLAGACVGAFLISAFILPVLGIIQTCLATALINLTALVVVLRYHPRFRR